MKAETALEAELREIMGIKPGFSTQRYEAILALINREVEQAEAHLRRHIMYLIERNF